MKKHKAAFFYRRYCEDCDNLFTPVTPGNLYCGSCLAKRHERARENAKKGLEKRKRLNTYFASLNQPKKRPTRYETLSRGLLSKTIKEVQHDRTTNHNRKLATKRN